MRKMLIKIASLLVITILLVACTSNEAANLVEKTNISDQDENYKAQVIIKGYYDEPDSARHKETTILKGVSEGEFVEILIQGEIKDFEHVRLEWDSKKSELVEIETLNTFDKLTNQTIVINTYMPDGIPSEKIKWKSINGKAYEYIIQDYSLSDDNNKEQVFNLD